MNILHDDNHLLAVGKPAGLLTQASGTQQSNLEDLCKGWLKEKYAKPGNVFLQAVHRLDKPASGVVLFAKTSKALSRLNASMRAKETHKCYRTIVCGIPAIPQQTLEHYMTHGDHRSDIASAGTPGASLARLSYAVVSTQGTLALLEVELDTGRYHQIRSQLAAIGHPILGDERYGGRGWNFPDRIALHHYQLVIPHPISKELLVLTAPLPDHWPLQQSL